MVLAGLLKGNENIYLKELNENKDLKLVEILNVNTFKEFSYLNMLCKYKDSDE